MLALFEQDPETRVVVMFGEPGTDREEEAARFIASGGFTKPVVAMIPGEFWETSPTPASVSHTGALIERGPRRAFGQEKAAQRSRRPRGRAILPGRAPRETSPQTSLENIPEAPSCSEWGILFLYVELVQKS